MMTKLRMLDALSRQNAEAMENTFYKRTHAMYRYIWWQKHEMQLASKLRMLDALSRQNAEAVAEVANKGKEITQLTTQIEVFVFWIEI